MKKPSSKIREEIARLQGTLKAAEAREAERIGRIALKAGLSDTKIDEGDLQAAFEEMAGRFRTGTAGSKGRDGGAASSSTRAGTSTIEAVQVSGSAGET